MSESDAPLIFRSLDTCDGCGTTLKPDDRLSGLCESCQAPRPQEDQGE